MVKNCPSCKKNSWHRVDSSKCERKEIGGTTTGCGQVDFEVYVCYNQVCSQFKKRKTKSIPCKCVKRHDRTNKA